jgi:hypothetical protein
MDQNVSSPQAVSASNYDDDANRVDRFALCVGVTGHRPNKLNFADTHLLHHQIRTALQFLKETITGLYNKAGLLGSVDAPVLRVVSPLAEGSDRLVAQEGLALGFELYCPLPFPREEYEKDFESQASRAEFHQLFGQASEVIELDGSRRTLERQRESYEAAGRIVLLRADVLIAIWDGAAGARGGTSQIVIEAKSDGIPIIRIHSSAPHLLTVITENEGPEAPWAMGSQLLAQRIYERLLRPQTRARNSSAPSDVPVR